MSDIEKMLRDVATDFGADISSVNLMEAADEIERLRAENAQLREENIKLGTTIENIWEQSELLRYENKKLRKALNGWQDWWAGPREGKRPDIAELIYRRAADAIMESGDE